MASMDNQWQKVNRSDNVQEYFMKGKFITSDTWIESNPPVFSRKNYPYRKDCFRSKGNELEIYLNNKFNVTEFIHVTSCENALKIINDRGFLPGTKSIPGIGGLNLIWFGLKVGKEQIDSVRMNYTQYACNKLLFNVANILAYEFANTAPFQPMSRYGNVKFTLSITEVLQQYEVQFCRQNPLQMRKLGTFAYRMEIMHVILVCDACDPLASHFPQLDKDDPIIIDDDRTWTWKPHSTGEQIVEDTSRGTLSKTFNYKRWEHVTFAFHVPEGRCLRIEHLNTNVSLCLHLTDKFNIFCIHNAIFTMLHLIQRELGDHIRNTLSRMLLVMIQRHVQEMELYNKKVNSLIGDVIVDEQWVQSSFKAMLPKEFAELRLENLL